MVAPRRCPKPPHIDLAARDALSAKSGAVLPLSGRGSNRFDPNIEILVDQDIPHARDIRPGPPRGAHVVGHHEAGTRRPRPHRIALIVRRPGNNCGPVVVRLRREATPGLVVLAAFSPRLTTSGPTGATALAARRRRCRVLIPVAERSPSLPQ